MAFGDFNKTDNNRTLHAPSWTGDPTTAEGSFEVQMKLPSPGMWGTGEGQVDGQAMPNPSLQNDGVEDISSQVTADHDNDLLGGDVVGESSMKDDDYPNLPSGGDGTSDVNFDSVGPFHYPDFGGWAGQAKTAFTGALRSVRD